MMHDKRTFTFSAETIKSHKVETDFNGDSIGEFRISVGWGVGGGCSLQIVICQNDFCL